MPPLPLLVLVPPPLLLQALPPLRPPVPSVLALPQPPLVLVALLLTTVAAPLDATLARLEVPRARLPTVARMLVPPPSLMLPLAPLPRQPLVLFAVLLPTVAAPLEARVLAALPQQPLVLLAVPLPTVAALQAAMVLATLVRLEVWRAPVPRGAWGLVPPPSLELPLPSLALLALLIPTVAAQPVATVLARLPRAVVVKL